jgi:hypothetical protein
MLAGRAVSRKMRWQRAFTATAARSEILDVAQLPDRITAKYQRKTSPNLRGQRYFIDASQLLKQATSSLYNGRHLLGTSS